MDLTMAKPPCPADEFITALDRYLAARDRVLEARWWEDRVAYADRMVEARAQLIDALNKARGGIDYYA